MIIDKEFCKKMSEIANKYNKIEEYKNQQIMRMRSEEAIPDILEKIEDVANRGEYTLIYKPKSNMDILYLIQLLRDNYGLKIFESSEDFQIDWKKY
jgi:hypothetical protein